jgi:redox-sensitive bicupin YhaK (pirin superfamily)
MQPPPSVDPARRSPDTPSVELVIEARSRDLGGFSVRRVLPSAERRLVGPFIFFDHMGPVRMPVGEGMDVRPHPHIALATVTYLFDGEILHRDSLGSFRAIHPGDVNWMLAGRGIVHSERSSPQARLDGVHLHGIQSWVALPAADEELPPAFDHHPASSIPFLEQGGARLTVIAGTAYGEQSPVRVRSPTLYVDARLGAGSELAVDDTHAERAVYVVEGAVRCDGRVFPAGTMVLLRSGARVSLQAEVPARAMLVGGAKLDGERHIWWNFVSSSRPRIDRAAADWRAGRFPRVPGDEHEFIPLPAP